MSQTIKCLNCGTRFSGKFCHNCGQKAGVKRLEMREILEEFFLSPLHIHPHGLLYTFIWLFKAPGRVIFNYIAGQRKLLHPAFRYLVLSGTLATLIIAIYHPFETDAMEAPIPMISGEFISWVSSHITLVNLISVPIFALWTYVFFKKRRFNYAENLTLQAYIVSQQLWILVILFPFFQFAPGLDNYINTGYSILTVVYNIYVVMDFFRMRSLIGFALSILAFVYAYVCQFLITYLFFELFGHAVALPIH